MEKEQIAIKFALQGFSFKYEQFCQHFTLLLYCILIVTLSNYDQIISRLVWPLQINFLFLSSTQIH